MNRFNIDDDYTTKNNKPFRSLDPSMRELKNF